MSDRPSTASSANGRVLNKHHRADVREGRTQEAPPSAEVVYDRAVLVEVLTYHTRDDIKGCRCGWAELGRSWPEHVATVYEQAVEAAHG